MNYQQEIVWTTFWHPLYTRTNGGNKIQEC